MLQLRHRGCLLFFKGILALVGVTLFIAQLSCKFYQCASIPPQETRQYLQAHGLSVRSVSLHNSDRHEEHLLSLDKRYDLKDIYYLPGSLFSLPPLQQAAGSKIYFISPKAVSRPNLLSSLRAPPPICA